MKTEALVHVAGVSRRYGRLTAVERLSFCLQPGQVLGLLGANGAGKSSMMKMIAGVLALDEGCIRIAGHDLIEEPLAARACIGFLPEQSPLYDDLTVDEYLGYCARLRRVARARLPQAVATAKAACGLDDSGHRLLRHLSHGFRRRAGIAQAIVHDPAVLILDEPTSGLDPLQIIGMRELVRTLGRERGILFSSHILSEVHAVCDRVLILHHGRLVLDRTLEQLDAGGPRGFCLTLRNPPPLATLAARAHGGEVVALGEGRFRIRHDERDLRDALARAAVEGDWGLLALTPEQDSLEEVFLRLVGEQAAASEPVAATGDAETAA